MFSHEGPASRVSKNWALAGYLALVAGFVNSGGFILCGAFTSHVTGNVGRVGIDLAQGHGVSAAFTGFLVLMFFTGAFVASLLVEAELFGSRARTYSAALIGESLLLGSFVVLAVGWRGSERVRQLEVVSLCVAMGMQNSLVTRLSGAVIRTTHLTGIVTDLGIESARWMRLRRMAATSAEGRAAAATAVRLLTLIAAFACGALLGAVATLRGGAGAMLGPTLAIVAAGVYAATQSTPRG